MNLYVTSLMKHRAQKSILFTAAEHINAYVLQLYVILTLFFSLKEDIIILKIAQIFKIPQYMFGI